MLAMNLLLLKSEQITDNRAIVTGRQLDHLIKIQRVAEGDWVRTGLINGDMGRALITQLDSHCAELELELDRRPPAPLPLTIVLALPRPKMLRRILQTTAAMGVKQLYLINSSRVEKSFWQSPLLEPEALQEQMILGLEQAQDTLLPAIHIRKLFKPFIEDELGGIITGTQALVAQPGTDIACPINSQVPITLAIGPEGGFIPYEVKKLNEAGFESVHLGPRILRVENAVPALISRLYPA
jgi:16S rRNA (uracil1498-N3)-methyltransferase